MATLKNRYPYLFSPLNQSYNALQRYKKSLSSLYVQEGKANQHRFSNLCHLIYAVIYSGHCSLQKLGEGMLGAQDVESRVKKAKRFMQSKYTDYDSFFLPYIQALLAGLGGKGPLFLVIDGSQVGNSCMALMVSLVWGKRSLPLVWVVCRGKKGHLPTHMHLELLGRLRGLLHTTRQVILLGDGEFDSCQLQHFATQSGWAYVLRTAKDTQIHTRQGDCFSIGEAYPVAGTRQLWIADCWVFKQKYGQVNALVWHEPNCENPLYLLSNLESGLEVVEAYPKRFSIETLFGDLKSRGFNIDRVRVKKPEMITRLLMVISLAFLLLFALGINRQEQQQNWGKILRKDRINQYSLFCIGKKIAQFLVKNQQPVQPQFFNNFSKLFCVRF